MKKKKITGQQIKFMINMVSIAIFAISYLYIYTGYVNKTEAAYNEIEMQKQYQASLEKKISQEDAVKQNIDDLNTQINTIINQYPVKIAKADGHMYVEQIQKDLGISFSSIDVQESVPFFTTVLPIRNEDGTEVVQEVTASDASASVPDATGTAQNNAATENDSKATDGIAEVENAIEDKGGSTAEPAAGTAASTLQTMIGTKTTIIMNFQATYQEFKEFVDYIANKEKKAVIDSVSVSVDSATGKLTGNLVLVFFALEGTGKVYEAPMIEDISVGTDNIFGTGNQDIEGQANEDATQATDDTQTGTASEVTTE